MTRLNVQCNRCATLERREYQTRCKQGATKIVCMPLCPSICECVSFLMVKWYRMITCVSCAACKRHVCIEFHRIWCIMFELEIEFSPICISNHLSGIYFAWIQHQPIGYWYNLQRFAFVSFHLISFDFTPSQSQMFSFSDQYSTRKYNHFINIANKMYCIPYIYFSISNMYMPTYWKPFIIY